MNRILIGVLASLSLIFVSGCGMNCNEIGCRNGVTFAVTDGSGAKVTTFSGDVVIGGQTVHVDCGGSAPENGDWSCSDGSVTVFTASSIPSTVDVHLSSGNGNLSFDGTLNTEGHTTSQPNGPGCEPVCEAASAAVVLQ